MLPGCLGQLRMKFPIRNELSDSLCCFIRFSVMIRNLHGNSDLTDERRYREETEDHNNEGEQRSCEICGEMFWVEGVS